MELTSTQSLTEHMKPGKVYRRADLELLSTAVDRELKSLCDSKEILKLSPGLYYRPKLSAFGTLPPEDELLVYSFLKDDRFLLTSFNHFNGLGLGLTQLYNTQVVYNYKRHGRFVLGSKNFEFKRVPNFPKKLSREFLVIDLLNNLKLLAENEQEVTSRLQKKYFEFDRDELSKMAEKYGRIRTKKLIKELYASA